MTNNSGFLQSDKDSELRKQAEKIKQCQVYKIDEATALNRAKIESIKECEDEKHCMKITLKLKRANAGKKEPNQYDNTDAFLEEERIREESIRNEERRIRKEESARRERRKVKIKTVTVDKKEKGRRKSQD